jgi:hypothetical protein
LAFCVKRVVNDKFALEDFMVAQPEGAETGGDPAQTLSSWMRVARMRVSSSNDFAEQNERWIG